MVWKGKLAKFESSNISETKEGTHTKLGTLLGFDNVYDYAKIFLTWIMMQDFVHQL